MKVIEDSSEISYMNISFSRIACFNFKIYYDAINCDITI